MAQVIIALDYAGVDPALELVDRLGPKARIYKVGLELYSRVGPEALRGLRERGKQIFLDLKLFDIPNTVARAVEAVADAGVDLLTVHTMGGRAMMEAAAEAAQDRVRLLGVTLLTSSSVADIEATWGRELVSVRDEVLRLAELAADCGLHGVIASPLEAALLKRKLGPDFLVVTPGIRLAGGDSHDQARVATPGDAVSAGADFMVVGRAITLAPDPAAALQEVLTQIEAARSEDAS